MSSRRVFWLGPLLAMFASSGCTSSESCFGAERCACFEDGSCDPGLHCSGSLCVAPEGGSGGETGTGSGGGNGGNPGGAGTDGAGGSGGDMGAAGGTGGVDGTGGSGDFGPCMTGDFFDYAGTRYEEGAFGSVGEGECDPWMYGNVSESMTLVGMLWQWSEDVGTYTSSLNIYVMPVHMVPAIYESAGLDFTAHLVLDDGLSICVATSGSVAVTTYEPDLGGQIVGTYSFTFDPSCAVASSSGSFSVTSE